MNPFRIYKRTQRRGVITVPYSGCICARCLEEMFLLIRVVRD